MSEKNVGGIDRRTVLKAAGAAGLLAGTGAWAAAPRKRYAVVGVGSRARMFTNAMTGKFRDTSEIVGVCDRNAGRLARAVKTIADTGASQPRAYAAADFDRMLRETKPQFVIVTTTDASHDDYIVRALDAGCDVITEKPMTTTAEKAQRIIDAVKRSGRQVRVTFNYRYSPPRTRQWTGGVAYDGRWRNVGEIGFSLQKTDYRKRLQKPGLPLATAEGKPWLYNATAAAHLGHDLVAFGSFTRGLEESGVAPSNALNRNELLPAIRTTQGDLGLRYALWPDMKLVATVFDLRKPYFNFDAGNRYAQLGDVQNRGLEVSLAGRLGPRLNMVAGAVLSRPRATGEGVRLGRVGERPVGMSRRSAELNLDWRTPWLDALSLDMTASHTGAITATVDNRVALPARTLVSLAGRYRFTLLERPASLRVAVSNLFDTYGLELRGAGAYDVINGRLASAYLSVDL